jgi:hypothetical protein
MFSAFHVIYKLLVIEPVGAVLLNITDKIARIVTSYVSEIY